MCGFVGAVGLNLKKNFTSGLSLAMDAIAHRGPDDEGRKVISTPHLNFGVGHRRLSIIDLTPTGRQPMTCSNDRYTLVFNGEAYNYMELRVELLKKGVEFSSQSDSEVLLYAWITWKEECLHRITGMFSFVVFDQVDEVVFCARDGFGIKPIYFLLDQENFYFASEIKSLQMILPRKQELNFQRAYDFLVYDNYDDSESTFFHSICQLMPGHLLEISFTSEKMKVSKRRWWIPKVEEINSITFEDAAEILREKFLANIRLHLRSDVPFAANLSGGLDSSAIVCAIRYLEPEIPLHTFTYVEKRCFENEEAWADLVNQHSNATGHQVTIRPEEFCEDIEQIIRFQGEPFGTTSMYAQYKVFQSARDNGMVVTLDGQGADEMLAGYHGYPQARIQSLIEKKQYAAILPFIRKWSRWPGRSSAKGLLYLIELLIKDRFGFETSRLRGKNPYPSWMKNDVLKDQGIRIGENLIFPNRADGKERRLSEALQQALTSGKLLHLLRILDRNSMACSMESRVPFLTTDLVEFLLSLPEEFLLSNEGQTKRIFRRAMKGIVPEEILKRKDKIGFAAPKKDWLLHSKEKVLGWMESLDSVAFLSRKKCHGEVSDILNGKKSFDWRAWRLVNFARWHSMQDF